METSVDPLSRPGEAGSITLQGHLDAVDGNIVYGWAWNPQAPLLRLKIEVWLGSDQLSETIADLPRPDLKDGGIGDGRHAFEARMNADLKQSDRHALMVYACDPVSGVRVAIRPHGIDAGGLDRLVKALGTLAGGQKELVAGQQAASRMLRDLTTAGGDGRRALAMLPSSLDRMETVLNQMQEQSEAFNLFLLRFDRQVKAWQDSGLTLPPAKPSTATRLALLAFGMLFGGLAVALATAVVGRWLE